MDLENSILLEMTDVHRGNKNNLFGQCVTVFFIHLNGIEKSWGIVLKMAGILAAILDFRSRRGQKVGS